MFYKKISTPIGVSIIILSAAVIFIFTFFICNFNESIIHNDPTPEKEEGEWSSYKNKKYNYQFNYPLDLEKTKEEEGITDMFYREVGFYSFYEVIFGGENTTEITHRILPNPEQLSLEEWFEDKFFDPIISYQITEKEEIVIGDIEVIKIKQTNGSYKQIFYLPFGEYIFSFSFIGGYPDSPGEHEKKKDAVYLMIKTLEEYINDNQSEDIYFKIEPKEEVGMTFSVGDKFDFYIYSHLEYGDFNSEEKTFTGKITFNIKSGSSYLYVGVVDDILINVDASNARILKVTGTGEVIEENISFSILESTSEANIPGPRAVRIIGEVYDFDNSNIFVVAETINIVSQ